MSGIVCFEKKVPGWADKHPGTMDILTLRKPIQDQDIKNPVLDKVGIGRRIAKGVAEITVQKMYANHEFVVYTYKKGSPEERYVLVPLKD